MTKEELKELRYLAEVSTKVNSWCNYGPNDQCAPNEATVRGPYQRWLTVSAVAPEYEKYVALAEEDAEFAAAAMNNLVPLLDYIDKLKDLHEFLERKLTESYSE